MNNKTKVAESISEFGRRTGPESIRFERVYRAPIERVWDAITTSDGLAAWMGPAVVEPREGGAYTIQLTPDVEMRGHIILIEPKRRLGVFWIEYEDDAVLEHGSAPDHHSELWFELSAVPEGTRFVMEQRLVIDREQMRNFGAGWHTFLDRLSANLQGAPLPEIGPRYAELRPEYEARIDAT